MDGVRCLEISGVDGSRVGAGSLIGSLVAQWTAEPAERDRLALGEARPSSAAAELGPPASRLELDGGRFVMSGEDWLTGGRGRLALPATIAVCLEG